MIQIDETKSINSDIVNLSDLIADKILEQAPSKPRKISNITASIFVEGEFVQELYGEIGKLDKLTIHYLLYSFDNEGEYNQWLRTILVNGEVKQYNSYSDYEDKYMQIVSAYINGVIMSDFAENILHEITHLYQYSLGMEKRKSLYDTAIELCTNKDETVQAVGRTIYYTFKHEQDAMTHQFYGYLLQNKPNGSFEDVCKKSEYENALNYLWIVNHNKEKAKTLIREIGLTIEQYNKRVHYGYKRFKQKLYNAYLLYKQEKNTFSLKNESRTFEISLKGQVIFDTYLREARKKYNDIEFDIETIYKSIKQ